MVEGPHAVEELLRSPRHVVTELFVTPAAATRARELLREAAEAGIPVRLVTERVAVTLSDTVTPQGVIAVARAAGPDLAAVLAARPQLIVVLHDVNDPGNAGTIVRTADAAGADAVVLTGNSVDPHNPKCIRASAGSLFHLPVLAARDAADVVGRLREHGVRVLATTLDGAESLPDVAVRGGFDGPVAWMFGSEARGLPPEVAAAADQRVRIPLYGSAESLNLAAAAAVCLYAVALHRHGWR